jgi:nucleotide-binding universal stress UspA family protein
MIKKILVPVDASEHAIKATRLACDLAEKYDAEIEIVNVSQEKISEEYQRFIDLEYSEKEKKRFNKILGDKGNEILKKVKNTVQPKMDLNAVILFGDPATNIVDYARNNDFDTIIMGSRGMSDIKGLLLGSVSHKVSSLFDGTCITVK